MKKTIVRILKRVLMYTAHIITNIVIQAMLIMVLVWHYDTPAAWYTDSRVKCYIYFGTISLILLIADFVINGIIFSKTNSELQAKKCFHLSDLPIVIPDMFVAVMNFFPEKYIGSYWWFISASVFVLAVNSLVIAERVILIRKK